MALSCPLGTTRQLPQEKFPRSHTINPLLTKLVRSRWLDIGFVFFASLRTSTPSRSIGQYPAILTEQPFLITNISSLHFIPIQRKVGFNETLTFVSHMQRFALQIIKYCSKNSKIRKRRFSCLMRVIRVISL